MTAGPDAGWEVELRAGRHIVGRSRHCAVAIDDPSVEPYHVLLTIDDEGGCRRLQLAGRMPVAVGGEHVDSAIRDSTRPRLPATGLVLGVTVPDPLGGGGGEPVVLHVDSLAIVDDHPDLARGQAIVRSLNSQATQQALTGPAHLLTAPGDPALEGCTSILEIGPRWRARWTPDASLPQHSMRLHAAGASSKPRSCRARSPGPATERDMNECALAVHHQ